jgi:pimeloyl-ACP methyl ester carboxylesterase
MWYKRETGSGRPLILLHGLGMSHAAWNPVTPLLSPARRVIAFDIAGFGRTPPLVDGIVPTVANLVDGLEQSIQAMELERPVDIAGNSLGGYMALEAAKRGMARSVVAISPAGLWKTNPPPHVKTLFACLRSSAKHFPNVLKTLLRNPAMRELAFAVPLSVGSRRMTADDATRVIDDLAATAAFEETFEQTRSPFSGRDITTPLTVAFGTRDWVLPGPSRCRSGLPPHARWIDVGGWGHVPMWADPIGVSQLILESTAVSR